MVELAQKSKITLTDFNPKRIATLPDTEKLLKLGVLIGRAVDTVKRQSPDKSQEYTGLSGEFEAYFAPYIAPDGKTVEPDPWKSSVLFMPDTFQNLIIDIIADKADANGQIIEEGAEAANFALEISVQRAGNAAGYEWVVRPLNDRPEAERKADKLAAMRALMGNSSIPALAAKAPAAITDQSGGTDPAPQETPPASGKKR